MAFYFPWNRYTKFKSRWNGRKDGRIGIPAVDQEQHAPYELELQKLAEENIRRIAQTWEKLDIELKSEYCKARFQYHAAKNGREAAEGEHADTSMEVENAQRMMKEIYGKEHLRPLVYVLVMMALAVFEFPLNSIVFDLFGEAKAMTYVMSAGIALVIPISAHFLGILLKKEPFKNGWLNTETALMFLTIAIPSIVLGFIAYLREKFFEAAGVQKMLGIQMDPVMVMIAFFTMNMLIYLVAAILSYFHHDPEIQQRRRELKQALEDLEEDSEAMGRFRALEHTTQRRYQDIRQRRQNEWDKKHHEAIEYKNIIERLVQHYRKHNLRARKDARQPKSFSTYPQIEIPKALLELDWDCSEIWPEMEKGTLESREMKE